MPFVPIAGFIGIILLLRLLNSSTKSSGSMTQNEVREYQERLSDEEAAYYAAYGEYPED